MLTSARACREHRQCVPLNFKQRLTCRVQHHPTLTVDQIAGLARIPRAWLLAYCEEGSDRHIPFEALLRVVKVTGAVDLVSVEIAEQLDHLVVPAPHSQQNVVAVQNETLDVQAAVGRLSERVRKATEHDGHIDEHEQHDITECVHVVRRELADVEAALGRIAQLRRRA